ncbi:MAG TPA: NAD(P)/FAD-dependent oxidoreductase [Candidatus Eisenbacteria bacterium]|nr:NAD(P)/FAD-dependent oxidoreductase [Candidatus Eisenbacteria bacterium]
MSASPNAGGRGGAGAPFDVVVVGAGANGLVAAARLAKSGLRVLLLERADSLGGQGAVVEFAPGFRAAPLGIDPGWLPPSVASGLGLSSLAAESADAPLSVAIGRGSFLTLSRDASRAAEAIRAHSASDAAKWPAFVARLHRLAGFLGELYQTPAPDVGVTSLGDVPALLALALKYRALGREEMIEFLRALPISVGELLDDSFECAPLKAAVAAGGIQDHRQGPRSGGTGFVLLHHLVGAPSGSVRGRLAWKGGPGAFTQAVEESARRAGVSIRTGAAVARISVRDDAATGVVLANGEEIAARTVLSTADPSRTLLEWVDPVWLDPEFMHAVGNIRHRGCTAVVLYGLEAPIEVPGLASPDALAGLVSLTPSVVALERAADAAKYGEVSEAPHVEITVPTLRAPGLADAGKQVLVARAQYAPYRLRDGAAWDPARRGALADRVTAAIEAIAPGFSGRVRHRVALSPVDLEERFALREGSPSQGELGLDQILFMRPVAGWGRHATPIAGLYLGGAGTHPGPGILGGAGWLAAKRLLDDRRNGKGRG